MEQIENSLLELFPPQDEEDPDYFWTTSSYLDAHPEGHERLEDFGLIEVYKMNVNDVRIFMMPFVCLYFDLFRLGFEDIPGFGSFRNLLLEHLIARYRLALETRRNSRFHLILSAELEIMLNDCCTDETLKSIMQEMSVNYFFCTYVRTRFQPLLIDNLKYSLDHIASSTNQVFYDLKSEASYFHMIIAQFQNYHLRYGLSTEQDDLISYFRGVPYSDALLKLGGTTIGNFLIEYLQLEDTLTQDSESESSKDESVSSPTVSIDFNVHIGFETHDSFNKLLKCHSHEKDRLLHAMVGYSPNLMWDFHRCEEVLKSSLARVAGSEQFQTHYATHQHEELPSMVQLSRMLGRIPSLKAISDDGITEWSGIAHRICEIMTIYEWTLYPEDYQPIVDYHNSLIEWFRKPFWHVN